MLAIPRSHHLLLLGGQSGSLGGAELVVRGALGDGRGAEGRNVGVHGGYEEAAVEGAEEGFEAGDGGEDEGKVHYG